MVKELGRVRVRDYSGYRIIASRTADEEKTCQCLKVPCECRSRSEDPGATKAVADDECNCGAEDPKNCTCQKPEGITVLSGLAKDEVEKPEGITVLSGLTDTQKFARASDKRWGINQSSPRRGPTADELSRMTPTQRFTANSNKRWGIK
jgi:hypothetical protein